MIEFRKPELSDREWVLPLLKLSDFRGCEYTFGNNYVWRNAFDLSIARYKNFYIVKNKSGFFFPSGKGDIAEVLGELEGYCREKDIPFVISSSNTLSMMTLKEIYGEKAEVTANTDDFDYIYRYEDLTELKGKKYHQKRNHIARFSENNWSYEEISPENIGECLEMNEEWLRRSGSENGRAEESAVAAESLMHFNELGYIGGILRVDGKIQAFTFGEPLNSDTFNVHVEKALTDYQGAYPMINRQFLLNSVHGFKFVNREEDTGEENLRKAKLSYYPCFMEEKFTVKIVSTKGR
ncbi:MAG: DUF2156 domain-containing protein [Ruminiclostridium sp.]